VKRLILVLLFLSSCTTISSYSHGFKFGKPSGGSIELGEARRHLHALLYPLKSKKTSSEFGPRNGKMHEGIDFPAPHGTKIFAAHDGTVIFTGRFSYAYGKTVIIRDENFLTLYAHLSEIKIEEGINLAKGDLIGEVGKTGNATGNHLHFETRLQDNKGRFVAIDPRKFLRR